MGMTLQEFLWVHKARRAPLYALGVVAIIAALSIGALTASPAQAEILAVDRTNDTTLNPPSNYCTGAANDCTLRWAITKANNNGQTDTIRFASGLSGTITLIHSSLKMTATDPTTIVGPASSAITVSGEGERRVLEINSGADATIKRLRISNGKEGNVGGGIYNLGTLDLINTTLSGNRLTGTGNNYGGGIYNDGTLELTNSTVSNNSATFGVSGSLGGGIYNSGGTVTLTNSTVSGNETQQGGGIANRDSGTLTLTNSTVSGNEAIGAGGGISNLESTLTLTNSTVSGNSATGGRGGGIDNFTFGGPSAATLLNTIVAGNTAHTSPDVSGNIAFTSQSNNLIGDTAGSAGWGTSDLQNVEPLLGQLQNNGGPTLTHALLQGSPAIDGGTDIGCPARDQRGALRQDGDADGTVTCDIGAFEAANTKPTITNISPTGSILNRRPTIAATVRDAQTNLAKSNIRLFVDGDRKTIFSYDRSTDRLSYTSGQLSLGSHTVRIVATEGVNSTTKDWSFKVVS